MNAPMQLSIPQVRVANLNLATDARMVEAFVRAHPASTPFHLPAWSVATEKGCGQKAHYLMAESRGEVVGVLPLTETRSLLFGRALVSAGFAVGGGVLAYDDAVAALLIERAMALATSLKCPTLELKGGARPASSSWHHDTETYIGFTRPLAADDGAELLAIPRKQRAEVRKSLENGLTIEVGSGPRDRAAHYATYTASVRNLGTPVFPRTLFNAVLDGFGNDADILTIRHNGTPVASVLSLYHNGAVMPYWGGGTAAARGLRANELMYYALMNHARARGCTDFDFGRSKVGTGAAAYKKNWGFEPQSLSYAKHSLDGSPPRSINPLDPKYALQVRLWQKLPLPIANLMGPMIARGLG